MARASARTPATRNDTAAPKPPKKPGRIRQMIDVFKYTQGVDRTTAPFMALALLLAIGLGVLVSWLVLDSPYYGIFLGLAVGLLAAMFILARKAERAAFARIKGQPGAALAAMQSVRRGWNVYEEPVQVDPRSQRMVFRAAGRAGILLVADDSSSPSLKLIEKERRAVRRVLPHEEVPVHVFLIGEGEDEVALHKVPSAMMRLKRVLTKDESAQVTKRLGALQRSLRQSIPQGVDPSRVRPNRKAMRGR